MTTTMLPDRVFEVLCDDSEFVLSRLEDSPDGQSLLGRPAATGLDLATVTEAQRARALAAANEELRRTLDAIRMPHHTGAEERSRREPRAEYTGLSSRDQSR